MIGNSLIGCLNKSPWRRRTRVWAEAVTHEEAAVTHISKGGRCLVFCGLCINLVFVCVCTKLSSSLVFLLYLDLRMTFSELLFCYEVVYVQQENHMA